MNDAPPATVRRAPARIVLETQPPRFQEMVAQWRRLHAEPYRGITTDGRPDHDLFPLRDGGPSTAATAAAASRFLESLAEHQRTEACFALDDRAWRGWSNIHRNVMRHGACLDVMSDAQRKLALGIVRTCVSERTFGEIVSTMRLNEHLAELTGKPGEYGEWFYYMSVLGEPTPDGPWGWQLDGHHVNINCFLLGGQMVLTPMLLGAEPVIAKSGKYAGTSILREEESAGWRMMEALSPPERRRAQLGLELPFDGLGSGFKDNLQVPYQGIGYAELAASQQEAMRRLLQLYVDRQAPPHAEARWAEVAQHLEQTHFAWMGPFDDTSPFYYRLHSPVIYVEYFHQPGIALPNNGFTRLHAHALVRTPNGNDYGRALLGHHRRRRGEKPASGDGF